MTPIIDELFATPGLVWLGVTFFLAGLVRGFAGFGTALIFMPIGTLFLPVPSAIAVVTLTGIATWWLMVPQAWHQAERREVSVLGVAAIVTAPLGIWLLSVLDQTVLRWAVAIAAGVTLAALISGWRYRGRVRFPGMAAIGAAAGVLGGATGLTGSPVILFYLAGPSGAAKVRANTILFLALLDLGIVVNLIARGLIGWADLWLGLLLAVPYGVGIAGGKAMFAPERDRLYRIVALAVIGAAIVTGLPLFD